MYLHTYLRICKYKDICVYNSVNPCLKHVNLLLPAPLVLCVNDIGGILTAV